MTHKTESFDDQLSTLRSMSEYPNVLRTSAKERAAIAMAVRMISEITENSVVIPKCIGVVIMDEDTASTYSARMIQIAGQSILVKR